MPAQRLLVTADLPGDLARLTRDHPGLRLASYPMDDAMLLRCDGDQAAFVKACKEEGIELGHRNGDGRAPSLFLPDQKELQQRLSRVASAGGVVLPPILWESGTAQVELLVLPTARPAAVVRALGDAKVVAKRPMSMEDVGREAFVSRLFFNDLTERQAEALLAAFEHGYYDSPRSLTTADVAKKMGVARSTFEEHLRRAESAIVEAVVPLVRMRLARADPHAPKAGEWSAEAMRQSVRFSAELGLWVAIWIDGNAITRVAMSERPPADEDQEPHPYMTRLLDHIVSGEGSLDDIPVHLDLTPFELEVLEQIRRIPEGEVRTYGDIAKAVGRPGAARAVGSVCAKNPVPLLIPCHRVVPASGALGNYSGGGGVRTKRRLLDLEGAWDTATERPARPRKARGTQGPPVK